MDPCQKHAGMTSLMDRHIFCYRAYRLTAGQSEPRTSVSGMVLRTSP